MIVTLFTNIPILSSQFSVELSKLKIRSRTLTAVHRSSYQTLHSRLSHWILSLCSVQQCALVSAQPDVWISFPTNYRNMFTVSNTVWIVIRFELNDLSTFVAEFRMPWKRRYRFNETKSQSAYYFSVAQACACAFSDMLRRLLHHHFIHYEIDRMHARVVTCKGICIH